MKDLQRIEDFGKEYTNGEFQDRPCLGPSFLCNIGVKPLIDQRKKGREALNELMSYVGEIRIRKVMRVLMLPPHQADTLQKSYYKRIVGVRVPIKILLNPVNY